MIGYNIYFNSLKSLSIFAFFENSSLLNKLVSVVHFYRYLYSNNITAFFGLLIMLYLLYHRYGFILSSLSLRYTQKKPFFKSPSTILLVTLIDIDSTLINSSPYSSLSKLSVHQNWSIQLYLWWDSIKNTCKYYTVYPL